MIVPGRGFVLTVAALALPCGEKRTGASQGAASSSAAAAAPAVRASPGAPDGVRLLVEATYDGGRTSELELERDATYRIARTKVEGGRKTTVSCTGALPLDRNLAIWLATDRVEFVAGGGGFQQAVPAPDAGARPTYLLRRVHGLERRAPPTEAAARSLADPIRTAIAVAEEKADAPDAPCSQPVPR